MSVRGEDGWGAKMPFLAGLYRFSWSIDPTRIDMRQLVALLAWSVRHRQSLIDTLEKSCRTRDFRAQVIEPLRRGEPLGRALARPARRDRVSPYLTRMLERAERDGRLDEAILMLDGQWRRDAQMARRVRSALMPLFPELFMGLIAMSFLLVFCRRIFLVTADPSMVSAAMPSWMGWLQGWLNHSFFSSPHWLTWLLLTMVALLVLFSCSGPARLLQLLLLRVPWVGQWMKADALRELCEAAVCYLPAGYDLRDAVEAVRDGTSRAWLRGRLRRFLVRTGDGVDWRGAFRDLGLTGGAEEWMLESGGSEGLAGGFRQLLCWLDERRDLGWNVRAKLIRLVLWCLYGIGVGAVVMTLWLMLVTVLYRTLEVL